MTSTLLIGNNLALLVAATDLAGKGKHVTLITDKKPLGGHFAGVKLNKISFDIGMVFVEHSAASSEPNADLLKYNPNIHHDWTRFGERVASWITERIDLIRAKTPEAVVDGQLVPDYLIANRLDGISFNKSERSASCDDPRHASHKSTQNVFDYISYLEAAIFNHGPAWHQKFVEPFVDKVFGVSSDTFLARYHRAGWVPLYHPETLELAAMGKHTGLPEYPFWTTQNGFVGQLIENVSKELWSHDNVNIIDEKLDSVETKDDYWAATTIEGTVYSGHQIGVGLAADRAASLLEVSTVTLEPASSVALLFATVKSNNITVPHGCSLIVDRAYASYRLTDQDAIAGLDPLEHRVVVEASPKLLESLHFGKSIQDALTKELVDLMGIDASRTLSDVTINVQGCFKIDRAFSIPTKENVRLSEEFALSLAHRYPEAVFTGGLLGYGISSMNDQIIQGLALAEKFS